MAYVAWNGQTYEGSPPAGWYYASDNRWWAPETGPGPYKPENQSPGPVSEQRYDQYQPAPGQSQQGHQGQVHPTPQPPPLHVQAPNNTPPSNYPAQSNSASPPGGHQPGQDQNAFRQSPVQGYQAAPADNGRPAPTQPLAGSYPGSNAYGSSGQQTLGGSNKNLLIAGGVLGAIVLIGVSVFLGSRLGKGDTDITVGSTNTTESAQSTTTTESAQTTTTASSEPASGGSVEPGTVAAADVPVELTVDDFSGTGDEALTIMYDYYSSVFGSTDLNGALEGLSPGVFPETDHPDDAALIGFSASYEPESYSRYTFQYVTHNSPDQVMEFYGGSLADFGISQQSDGSNETGAFKTMTSDKKTVDDYDNLSYTVTAQEANEDDLVVVLVECTYSDDQSPARDLGDGVFTELSGYLPLAKNFELKRVGFRAEAGLFGFITLKFSHDGKVPSLGLSDDEIPKLTDRFQALYSEVDPGWNTTYDEDGFTTAKHNTDKDLELNLSTNVGYKTVDVNQSLNILLDGDEFVNSIEADT